MQELPTIQPIRRRRAVAGARSRALSDEVRALAAERNAVILAHNYQLPEVQDVADYMGDSLGLSREAAATDADVIAFCGVHFMAETASILSPEKTVLIPDLDAGCSLVGLDHRRPAARLEGRAPRRRRRHVRQHLGRGQGRDRLLLHLLERRPGRRAHLARARRRDTEILFGPDMWLGSFVARETGLVDDPERYAPLPRLGRRVPRPRRDPPRRHRPRPAPSIPDAEFLIHPECGCSTQAMEYVAAGDIDRRGRPHALDLGDARATSRRAPRRRVHRRHRDRDALPAPAGRARRRNLIEANRMAFCRYMKMITLPKLRDSLRDLKVEVKVPAEIAERARVPIERMVRRSADRSCLRRPWPYEAAASLRRARAGCPFRLALVLAGSAC